MLEAGEDPVYIARRMVRFASEDVGLADVRALSVALNATEAVRLVGLPECKLALAQAARLPVSCSEIERTLHGIFLRCLRCAEDIQRAPSVAHPQCADGSHEGTGLWQRLSVCP